MALDPVPADLHGSIEFIKLLPELLVLHRVLGCGSPTVLLPVVDPGCDAVLDILAVSEMDSTPRREASSIAWITAVSSILLFVVWASPPLEYEIILPSERVTYAQPPGPGLPEQPPSVKISTVCMTK